MTKPAKSQLFINRNGATKGYLIVLSGDNPAQVNGAKNNSGKLQFQKI
jgi:hypothetical protein